METQIESNVSRRDFFAKPRPDISSEQGEEVIVAEDFSAMVEKYSDMAYNIALRMLRNPSDAEDAVQEAFLAAYRAFPTFKGQSKVSTWLYRIVVNACLMKLRKEKAKANYLTLTGYDDLVVRDWRNDPEEAAINGELHEAIEDGLRRLQPDQRATIVLKDVQGLSSEEAAEALEIGMAAFKSRLHRARILLRKYLETYLGKQAPA